MKKVFALILSAVIIISAAGCGSKAEEGSNEQETTAQASKAETLGEEVKKQLDQALDDVEYSGVVQITKNGDVIYTYVNGDDSNGKPLTAGASLPVGSVSKQFCAAAVMILQEKGKLSVNDKLDKYYPEYKEASKITLHQMLCHRSGIPNFDENTFFEDITYDHTDEENTKIMLKWVFEQPLLFEPDTDFTYSNLNFTLLSNIVEKVSGESYIAFLRENIFKPLGMEHTGSVDELDSSPEWAKGFSYVNDDFVPVGRQPGLCKGGGDIVSTAADMTLWIRPRLRPRRKSSD